MKIYTASSWKNPYYREVVEFLREHGHDVYDFQNTVSTRGRQFAFNWDQIDPYWEDWEIHEFFQALHHELSVNAFQSDYKGMIESDVCVLILPSGKSSHVEAGFMKGMGRKLIIYMQDRDRPELTYSIADAIVSELPALEFELTRIRESLPGRNP